MNNYQKGKRGELLARLYLIAKGFKIVEANYSRRSGEIDIIAKDKEYLVFVEVKYRKNTGAGLPREAVDLHKQRQIRNTALCYIAEKGIYDTPMRFDVVDILGTKVTHIKNAFE